MEKKIKLLRKELNITQETLARRLGIGKSALSMIETGKAALSDRNRRILIHELNVNPDWLETGKGEIFNAFPDIERIGNSTGMTIPLQSVPLYRVDGASGFLSLLNENIASENRPRPVDYISIPHLPKCDGAIYLVGDSMFPLLKTGDIVLYKKVRDLENIFWGDMYLLSLDMDGEEFVTVRYIRKSENTDRIRLVSYNPDHGEKEIKLSKVKALAYIKATIRMNTLI